MTHFDITLVKTLEAASAPKNGRRGEGSQLLRGRRDAWWSVGIYKQEGKNIGEQTGRLQSGPTCNAQALDSPVAMAQEPK